jgi:hypothetical protein
MERNIEFFLIAAVVLDRRFYVDLKNPNILILTLTKYHCPEAECGSGQDKFRSGRGSTCSILIPLVAETTVRHRTGAGITRYQTRTCSRRMVLFRLNGTTGKQKGNTAA